MRVTVFAPDDLQLVKGGPAGRRDYLDDLLVAIVAALRGGPQRLRAGAEAAQRACCAAACAAPTPSARSTCSTRSSSRAGARAGAGPAASSSNGWCPAVADGLRRRSPATHRRSPTSLRGRVGRRDGARRRPTRSRRCSHALARTGAAEVDRGLTLVGPAPRRVAAARRRAREPHARVAGRAAHARARAAARWAPAVRRAHRHAAGAAARRRVQRARRPARRSRSSRTSTAGQTLVTTAGAVPRGVSRRPHAARRRRPRRRAGVSERTPVQAA